MKQTPSNGPRRELALVIPALDPGRELPGLLARLRPDWAGPVVVVDDGSGRQAQAVFAAAGQLGATVLHHGGNRGKGAALKTALRYCRTAWPGLAGCVTADADGQHSAADILRVADALLVYPSYFARASVDGLLGVFCAALLLCGFLPGRTAASPWLEALGCFVLALVKSTGAGLAVLAAAALAAARGAFWRAKPGRAPAGAAVSALAPLGLSLAAKLSWSAHLAAMGAAERWQTGQMGLLRSLWSLLIGNIPPYRAEVLRQFADVMLARGNYGAAGSLPFLAWPLAFCLLMAAAGCIARAPRMAGLAAAALGVTAAFAAGLLYSYLFVFDPIEAVYLASVYRYLDSCVMLLCLTAALAAGVACCRAKAGWQAAPLAVCLAWAGLFPLGPAVQAVAEAPVLAAESRQERILSRRAAGRIRALGQDAPRVWVITANDGGAAQGRIEYDLLPLQLPAQASILMADPPEGAPWAREISAEEWSRELAEGFDYVYIYCPEDQFVRDYLAVFEPGSQSHVTVDQMFRVIPQADGTARLRWLPE